MAGKRLAAAARQRWKDLDGGSAFVLPLSALRHENFRRLSPHAVKLLMDMGRQFTGFNNGYLCAAWTLMRSEGWRSRDTLFWATRELEHYGWLERTKGGGQNMPNLYAFSWRRIDEKKDKDLDVSSTLAPSNAWKADRQTFKKPPRNPKKKRRPSTRSVLTSHAMRVNSSGVNTPCV